ncbi:IS256 family transposase [bacterium]|nr:IS256 family transposase [Candidatus Omnitrophota bacterium]MBU4346023.1 IS256 family transposase [Candidatus Omnitrophota bacterium]MCG2676999.1 IS256 family transposase [bacterium]
MQYLVFDSNVTQRWRRVKEFVESSNNASFWSDIKKHTRSLLKDTMQICMAEEMVQYTQRQKYQRAESILDYRNGYYFRNLDTELGPIDELKIPRSRSGLFNTKVFEHYQRRQKAVNEAICNVFLSGVSTRDTSSALKPILETTFSASCVSRVTKSLDKKVKQFHRRKLLDEYQFLFLDGITLSVKGSLKAVKKLVLVAYGITLFGKKELISFRIASSESQAAWEAFLNDLYNRGLKGENLKLIITDGCKGLIAALDTVYAYTKRQHCWVHKLRNVSKYLKKCDQKQVLSEAKKIYQAETKREAAHLFKTWKRHWSNLYPNAVNCIEKDLDALLAFLEISAPKDYAKLIRKRIRTTNVIERAFREVRRRTRPMSCFTNQDSVNRIIYAIFTRLNTKWEGKPLKEFTQFI